MDGLSDALEKGYKMGVLSGSIATAEYVLAVLERAAREHMSSDKAVQMVMDLADHQLEHTKTAWEKGLEAINEH